MQEQLQKIKQEFLKGLVEIKDTLQLEKLENEFFSRKFGGELFKGFVMVVKANQIQSLRFDDEIVGFRIVAG